MTSFDLHARFVGQDTWNQCGVIFAVVQGLAEAAGGVRDAVCDSEWRRFWWAWDQDHWWAMQAANYLARRVTLELPGGCDQGAKQERGAKCIVCLRVDP